ncbi:MAG TPA: hypothetical protein VI547_07920 [Anaerolineales bacterium]|nr:hypothetical protein [Anaerolineales bacterium]
MPIQNLHNLCRAIVIQMLKDWQSAPKYQQQIRAYIQSDEFAAIAEAIELSPSRLFAILELGQFSLAHFRSDYR